MAPTASLAATPDASPTPRPTPVGTPEPLLSLGATTRVFTDAFDDPTRWSVEDAEGGRVAYADGALTIVLAEGGALLVSSRPLPDPVPVLLVDGR